jgi:hypothetical protein
MISNISILHEISDKFRVYGSAYKYVEFNGPRDRPIFKIKAKYRIFSAITKRRTKRDAKRNAARQLIQKIKDLILPFEIQ